MRILYGLLRFLGWVVILLVLLWAVGALVYDFPWPALRTPAACLFAVIMIAALWWARGFWRKMAAGAAGFALVLAWWLTLQPSNERPWQPDVDRTAWADIAGDDVTFHNVRNCDYRTETDFTPRWETRTVHLSHLTGIDLAIDYWGVEWMAHPIVSFQFTDTLPICFSIETRREIGETYSAIGGLYRQFELIYVVTDERDAIRVRTNYRHGEDIYLYHLNITPDRARARFQEYLDSLNKLRDHPRWYNAITTNCTTSIRTQHAADQRQPWDWRILLNGYADQMLFEQGAFRTGGLPFAELKARSHINAAAKAANDAPDFSARIRVGLPSESGVKPPA
jgi:hypothetical protein